MSGFVPIASSPIATGDLPVGTISGTGAAILAPFNASGSFQAPEGAAAGTLAPFNSNAVGSFIGFGQRADNIFVPNIDIDISADEYVVDLGIRGNSRLLSQFRNSFVINEILCAFAREIDELQQAIAQSIELRTISQGGTQQLDVIGRIVGIDRIVTSVQTRRSFGFGADPDGSDNDLSDTDIGGWDDAPWTIDEETATGSRRADNNEYRRIILAKIFKNHVKACSIPEVIKFFEILTGQVFSIRQIGMCEWQFMPSNQQERDLIEPFLLPSTDNFIDSRFRAPIPAGFSVRIATALNEIPRDFSPAQIGGGADFALILNQSGGVTTAGAVDINVTNFVTPRGVQVVSSSLSTSVETNYEGSGPTGRFFIMYTTESREARFTTLNYTAGNFVPVVAADFGSTVGGQTWAAIDDTGTEEGFTPLETDVIIAVVERQQGDADLSQIELYTGSV